MRFLFFYTVFFLLYLSSAGFAQSIKLHVELRDSVPKAVDIQNKLEDSYKDSVRLKSRLKEAVSVLRQNGYMAASFDDLNINDKNAFVSFYPGEQFHWGKFDFINLPDEFDEKNYKHKEEK